MRRSQIVGWALLVALLVGAFPLNAHGAFDNATGVLSYSAALGVGVGLTAPKKHSLGPSLLVGLGWAVLLDVVISLILAAAAMMAGDDQQAYGIGSYWILAVVYFGFALIPVAVLTAGLSPRRADA